MSLEHCKICGCFHDTNYVHCIECETLVSKSDIARRRRCWRCEIKRLDKVIKDLRGEGETNG